MSNSESPEPGPAPVPATPRRRRRHKWSGSVALFRFARELLSVFIGVLAAFAVDNYRDRRSQEERAREIYLALLAELDDHQRFNHFMVDSIGRGLTHWQTAYVRGDKPAPFYFRIEGSEHGPSGAWQAAVAAQGVTLIDPQLMYKLSQYYDEEFGIGDRFVRNDVFTEEQILPSLRAGTQQFYDPATGTMKPIFAEHMERLAELRRFLLTQLPRGDTLEGRLRAEVGRLPP